MTSTFLPVNSSAARKSWACIIRPANASIPGNSGTLNLATNLEIQIDDFSLIESAIIANEISLVIVGPEVPLVNGIHDFLINNSLLKDIIIIGPKKEAAQLEGSKDYAKEFLNKHNIPT